jgi:hypothetical protein
VQIDGTIFHGWLLLCALSALLNCGAHATTSRTASRFISFLSGSCLRAFVVFVFVFVDLRAHRGPS